MKSSERNTQPFNWPWPSSEGQRKEHKKNKEKDVHLHVFIEYVKLIVLFCFFSIKRELKVITHTKVKFLKSFTWFIGGVFPQIDMKPIQISLEVDQVIL